MLHSGPVCIVRNNSGLHIPKFQNRRSGAALMALQTGKDKCAQYPVEGADVKISRNFKAYPAKAGKP